jgi:hypothetical protein
VYNIWGVPGRSFMFGDNHLLFEKGMVLISVQERYWKARALDFVL